MKWGSIGSTTGSRDDFKGLIYADKRWALVIESCRHYNLILPGPRCRAGGPFRNHQLCSSLGSEARWTRHIIPLAARQITFKGWIRRSCYSTARLEPGSHLQSLWFIVEAEIVRGTAFIVWRTNSSTIVDGLDSSCVGTWAISPVSVLYSTWTKYRSSLEQYSHHYSVNCWSLKLSSSPRG